MSGASLGRRIVVYGPTASGKTTLARRLGAALDLPVIGLDDLRWLPGWRQRPRDDFVAVALDAVRRAGDAWVCDGNYVALRHHVLPLADTVVWLDLPFRVTYPRLLQRSIREARTRATLWAGNPASWRSAFGPRSLLVYAVRHRLTRRRRFDRLLAAALDAQPAITTHRLTSARAVDAFLVEVAAASTAASSS